MNWLNLAFPWIGLAGAAVLLFLLFGTSRLRSDPTTSPWRDRVWLSWMAMVAYLIHNVEEYGVDALGHWHAFPDALCGSMHLPAYPDCPIPPAFYPAVNISVFWIAAPLAAMLGHRRPIVAFALYGVVFINALVHLVPLAVGMGYGPGLLTAIVVFLPLSVWVGHSCFGSDRLSYKVMAVILVEGVLMHIILAGSIVLFLHGMIGATALVIVQVLNAALLLLIPWAVGKWRGGVLARPVRSNQRF